MEDNLEYQEKEIVIDPTKVYSLPKYTEVSFKGRLLVIFQDIAKWLVLDNSNQSKFWDLLKFHSIEDSLKKYSGNEDDAEWVIAQIEGKNICNTVPFEKEIEPMLQLHLTNKCNLYCPHCYMNAGRTSELELSKSEILNIIRTYYNNKGKKLILSGGEPCLHPNFKEIVNFCYDLKLNTEVLTNGLLWDEQLIAEIGPKTKRIQISIDGYNEKENAKVRGKGTFDKIIEKLYLFNKYKINLEIAITPLFDSTLESKVKDYSNFGKWLMEEFKSISAINFTGDIFDGRDLQYSITDKKLYRKIAEEIYKGCYNRTGDEAFISYHQRGGLEGQCNFGNLAIKANGDLFFCPLFQLQKPFANVKDIDLDILFKRISEVRNKTHITSLYPCQNCELKFICGGECRINFFKCFKDNSKIFSINGKKERICTDETKNFYYDMLIRTNADTLM